MAGPSVVEGQVWIGRWMDQRLEVIYLFRRDGETRRFSAADYQGDIGHVLVANLNDLSRRWVMTIAELCSGYISDERSRIYSDAYRCAVNWEPER